MHALEKPSRRAASRSKTPQPPIWEERRFDALKLRFDDQVALVRKLTDIDLQVFGGYLTISLAFGSWLSQNPRRDASAIVGLLVISLTLAISTSFLLYFNFKRRVEVVATIKNINVALGYEEVGAYIPSRALNAPTIFRPWRNIYFLCIWFVFAGILLILTSQLNAA